MDGITRIQPLLDELKPKDRKSPTGDPLVDNFLDCIDRTLEKAREQRKAAEEAALEARRLQAEYDRKLAFLKSKVECAFQAMLGVAHDLYPGSSSPEQREYYYWVSQLESFKQQGRIGGLL